MAENRLGSGLQPTEPKRGAWGVWVLRPSHKFSRFSGTFNIGITMPCTYTYLAPKLFNLEIFKKPW
jgi:hypothetical protein